MPLKPMTLPADGEVLLGLAEPPKDTFKPDELRFDYTPTGMARPWRGCSSRREDHPLFTTVFFSLLLIELPATHCSMPTSPQSRWYAVRRCRRGRGSQGAVV